MKTDVRVEKDLFLFLFSTRASFLEKKKKKERKASCSKLVPCQASSPPFLVQALHRLCTLHNSIFWKQTEEPGPVQSLWIPAICVVES
jgi:hypothetical protein